MPGLQETAPFDLSTCEWQLLIIAHTSINDNAFSLGLNHEGLNAGDGFPFRIHKVRGQPGNRLQVFRDCVGEDKAETWRLQLNQARDSDSSDSPLQRLAGQFNCCHDVLSVASAQDPDRARRWH